MSQDDEKKDQKVLNKFLAATDELMDAVQQISDRFVSKGSTFSITEALGQEGEVSVPIAKGGTGEVILSLGKGLHNYPAQANDSVKEFKRGARVYVVQLANQTLLVEDAALRPAKNGKRV